MGVPVCNVAGTAIDGFDRGQVHAINVADDSCSLLHLPASDIIAESEDGPKVTAELISLANRRR